MRLDGYALQTANTANNRAVWVPLVGHLAHGHSLWTHLTWMHMTWADFFFLCHGFFVFLSALWCTLYIKVCYTTKFSLLTSNELSVMNIFFLE